MLFCKVWWEVKKELIEILKFGLNNLYVELGW